MFEFRSASRLLAVAAIAVPLTLAGQGIAAAQPHDSPEARAAALIKPAIVYIEAKFSGWVIDENGNALNNGDPFDIVARCTGFAVKSDRADRDGGPVGPRRRGRRCRGTTTSAPAVERQRD